MKNNDDYKFANISSERGGGEVSLFCNSGEYGGILSFGDEKITAEFSHNCHGLDRSGLCSHYPWSFSCRRLPWPLQNHFGLLLRLRSGNNYKY